MKKILWLLIVFSFVYLSNAQESNRDFPQAYSWVNDYADLLDDSEEKLINDSLKILEKMSSTQVYIAIVEKIPENYDLEKYSYDLATSWKIGAKDKNNGILLLVSLSDKKMRIEVGYGLEGVLTDALCAQIIRNEITPQFKARNYYGGLINGANAITKAVRGEYKAEKKDSKKGGAGWFVIVIIFIIFVAILNRGGGGRGRGSSRGMWIGSSGSSGWGGFSGGSSGGGFSGGGGGSFGGGGASGSW